MPLRTCTVPGCDRKVKARDLCKVHYERLMRRGTTELHVRHPQTYRSMHQSIARNRGNASDHSCVDCGNRAAHWSYNHECPDEQMDKRGVWCPHPEHYSPRCISCHRAHDGTTPRGTGHHHSVLTPEVVCEIRKALREGESMASIARRLGVKYGTVNSVKRRQTWKHLDC